MIKQKLIDRLVTIDEINEIANSIPDKRIAILKAATLQHKITNDYWLQEMKILREILND